MKQIIIISLSIIFSSACVYSQDYFIVNNKDTTFCSNLWYGTNPQGYLNHLKYTTVDGKEIEIEKKKNVPNITTFFQDGHFIDKTPLKASKPDSYVRYTERAVDGKLIVYTSSPYASAANTNSDGSQGNVGSYRFIIKMPDGKYYKINDKGNMKKHIIPYLNKCSAFKTEYKGEFKTKEEPFIEMIELYNTLCK